MKPRRRLLLRANGSARSDKSGQNPDIPPNVKTKSLEHCVSESPYTDFNAGRLVRHCVACS